MNSWIKPALVFCFLGMCAAALILAGEQRAKNNNDMVDDLVAVNYHYAKVDDHGAESETTTNLDYVPRDQVESFIERQRSNSAGNDVPAHWSMSGRQLTRVRTAEVSLQLIPNDDHVKKLTPGDFTVIWTYKD